MSPKVLFRGLRSLLFGTKERTLTVVLSILVPTIAFFLYFMLNDLFELPAHDVKGSGVGVKAMDHSEHGYGQAGYAVKNTCVSLQSSSISSQPLS